jgi:acyl-CoA reductase-like NAD-dependent aldehyde dehydrogenase
VVVDKDADLDHALARIIFGGYYQSGQSCIHVQRVIIHQDIYDTFRDMLAAKVKTLVSGDPKSRDTFIGPMISEKEARRLKGWIDAAVAGGATLLAGGGCEGAMLQATLLEGCSRAMDVYVEEAFGPVVILSKFAEWDEALAEVNDSKFGLQAGLFTRDLHKVLEAWDSLEVGGVVVNDVSSYRVDNMPYGGVKDSGLGREGVRFAIEDMTEIRNLVIRRV